MWLGPDVQEVAIGSKCISAVVSRLIHIMTRNRLQLPELRVPLVHLCRIPIFPATAASYVLGLAV